MCTVIIAVFKFYFSKICQLYGHNFYYNSFEFPQLLCYFQFYITNSILVDGKTAGTGARSWTHHCNILYTLSTPRPTAGFRGVESGEDEKGGKDKREGLCCRFLILDLSLITTHVTFQDRGWTQNMMMR